MWLGSAAAPHLAAERLARRAGPLPGPRLPAGRRSTACTWYLAGRRAPGVALATPPPASACACSRPSIRSSGTAARFEAFWGWAYRFEAYTPAARRNGCAATTRCRCCGVTGWWGGGNASVTARGELALSLGYVDGRAPHDVRFSQALEDEVESLRRFLGLGEVSRRAAAPTPSSSASAAPCVLHPK
jgi:hypothetical protein